MNPLSLYHGDCIDVMRRMPAASIDFVLTDPPYGCHYRSRDGQRVANDNSVDWVEPAFIEIVRLMRHDSLCISFYGWNQADHFLSAWKSAGLAPVGHIVWPKHYASKTGFLASKHEQAYLLAKGHPPKPERPLSDVQRWIYSGNPLHPTQKAVEILEPLIACFTRPGDTVLDPFMGSGSTGHAAGRLGRRFVGIELEERHFETASHRLYRAFPQTIASPRTAA